MKREHQERAINLLQRVAISFRACTLCEDVRRLLDEIDADAKAAKEKSPEFDGDTYDPAFDECRLATLLGRVFDQMKDGAWRSLWQIGTDEASEASISARLRDLRKPKFGSYIVQRRRLDLSFEFENADHSRIIFEYRLLSPTGEKIK